MNKWIIIVLLSCFSACSPIDFAPQSLDGTRAFEGDFFNKLLVLNEGTFNYQNASLGALQLDSLTYESNVFTTISGRGLGDVAQSMLQVGDLLLIAVNNSNKIEVINLKSSTWVATIEGAFSPRLLQLLANNKVLVTDMYTDFVYTINLETFTIDDSLFLPGRTEAIIRYTNKIFVSRMNKPLSAQHDSKVFVLNELATQIIDSFSVSVGPIHMHLDASNNLLWVLCDGGVAETEPKLEAYSLTDYSRMFEFTLGSTQNNPQKLTYNTTTEELLWLNNGVEALQLSTIENGISKKITPANSELFYSLNYLPNDSLIVVGNANDYLSNGTVILFNSNYEKLNSIEVGVIPTDFLKVTF